MSLEQKAQKGMKWKNQKYFVIYGYSISWYYATTINDVCKYIFFFETDF